MPPSVHKILIHSSLTIKYTFVSIGQLSEKTQEIQNKDYVRFQENNSRKSLCINTNRFI